MSSNIAKDLYEAYLNEMEPQLGKKKEEGGSEGGGGASSPDEAAVKRIRQAVYDIRYRARREDIDVSQAYSQYMSNTSMAANEKAAVRDKLGLGTGGQAGGQAEEVEHVDEDAKPGERYLRVKPQRGTGEKEYVRTFDPKNPLHRQKAARLRSKGISVTQTSHGNPYDKDYSKAGEKYEKKYGPANGKNTVGDKDKDGTVEPDRHEYAGVRDNAIKKAKAKKKTSTESFSDWREEIREVVEKANAIKEKDKQIKEKAVNNTINVNPDIPIKELADNLGAELVESVDLGEDFEEMVADYATEYFFAEGLNENGIDILIEDIGVDDFVDYVLDLFEEFEEEVLSEARAGGAKIEPTTKTGKSVGSLKGGAKAAAIKRLRGEKAKRSEAEASASAEKPSGMTAALKKQSEKAKVAKGLKKASTEKKVEKAKASQAPAANKSSEGTKKEVKKGILGAIRDRAAKDSEKLKKSFRDARAVGKKYEKKADKLRGKAGAAAGTAAGAAVGAAKAVHRAGQEAGKSEAGQKVKKTLAKAGKAAAAGAVAGAKKGETNTAAGRAGRAVGTFLRKMKEDYELWIEELVDEGYDVWEYDELYLIETYLPEDLDEGLGSALKGMITKASDKMKQSQIDAAKKRLEQRKAQRKTPSTPIRKPNTSARDPWSGDPDTDKAWAKDKGLKTRSASTPYAYKGTHEEFEEWMEAVLAEGLDIDENMLFLIYESSFAEEVLLEKKGLWDNIHAKRKRGEKAAKPGDKDYPETLDVDEGKMATARANVGADKCWDGYKAKGTKKKNGKTVPNCVKEDEKLENVISQIRDTEEVDEGVAAAAKVAGRLAMRALTSKAAKKAAKKVGKSALAGATAGASEKAAEAAYNKTRNLGKKKVKDDDEEYTEEYVDERTRYAKETGKDPQTGKPSVKGGEKQDPAFAQVSRELRKTGGMMSSRRNPIQPQGKKKVPGAKGPKGVTPVDRIRGKLAKKRAPKPDIGSRFD